MIPRVTKVTAQKTVNFNSLKISEFIKLLKEEVKLANSEISDLTNQKEVPTFENTVERLDFIGSEVNELSSVFFNLNSAETTDEIQAMAPEFSAILTAYGNDVLLNQDLFMRVKAVWEIKDSIKLNPEQYTLLENTYLGFVRNGALLNDSQKNTFYFLKFYD